jgi:hypothetical protein
MTDKEIKDAVKQIRKITPNDRKFKKILTKMGVKKSDLEIAKQNIDQLPE